MTDGMTLVISLDWFCNIMSMKDIFLNLTRSNNAADCNIADRIQDAA